MRPVAVYSALRLGLFLVCLAVALLLGARPILAVAIAAAASLVLSYITLRRQRDQVARAIVARRTRAATADGEVKAGRPGRRASFSQFLRADAAAEDEAAERIAADLRKKRGTSTR